MKRCDIIDVEITKIIKSQRIRWLGNMERMNDMENAMTKCDRQQNKRRKAKEMVGGGGEEKK